MIEPPETPHHVAGHHRTAIKWFDVAMAVAVLVVSFGSLFVALHTGHTMEKLVEQNQRLVYAQSTPILQFTTGNYKEGRDVLGGTLTNVGSGAARIVWIRFMHDGQTFVNWQDLIRKLNNDSYPAFVLTSGVERTILSAGEAKETFEWAIPADPSELPAWRKLNDERWKVTSRACFCSLFDECWTSNLGGDPPVRVESCETPRPLNTSLTPH
jgi:peptidoglycan/xylan/chitin deacetylase (PgdA/CDA1 family)